MPINFTSDAGTRFSILAATISILLLTPGCRDSGTHGRESNQGQSTQSAGTDRPAKDARHSAVGASQVRFRDISQSSGVGFTYRNGEEAGHYSILESLGGGASMLDYDRDGALDIFLPGGGRFGQSQQILGLPGALYRQTASLVFQDVTGDAHASAAPHYNHGAHVADFDNDGFTDVLVTGYGGLLLLQNQGDGTFQNVTQASGLNADELWSSSAAWADLTGDGNLDLYVAHYVDWSFENHPVCQGPPPDNRDVCPPRDFDPLPDMVFFSRGNGTFEDRSAAAGLRKDGKGLGVVCADVDVDGDIDIYVANDTVANFLYLNEGNGLLKDVSLLSGASMNDRGQPEGSMGVDVLDYNMDGLPDLWCVNYENESLSLYRNDGTALFQHVSQSTGIQAVDGLFVSWGTVFFDIDCDRDEDTIISNGHVIRYPANAPVRQTALLLLNESGKRFVNVSDSVGQYFRQPHMGRGLAAGDLDDDGRLDLVVSHMNEPAAVLHNETRHGRHWIGLRLIGTRSPRDAIGARVEIDDGSRKMMRQVKGGSSYASTHDRRVHFGLGDLQQVGTIRIVWPSGIVQTLSELDCDRYYTVIEPQAPGKG